MAHAFREKRGVFRLPVAAGTPSVAGVVSLVELGRDKRVVLELWPGFRMLTKSSAPMCIFLLRGELAAGSFYRVRNAERASKRAIARRSSELLPARGTSHWSLRRMPDAVRAATARAMRPSWRRCALPLDAGVSGRLDTGLLHRLVAPDFRGSRPLEGADGFGRGGLLQNVDGMRCWADVTGVCIGQPVTDGGADPAPLHVLAVAFLEPVNSLTPRSTRALAQSVATAGATAVGLDRRAAAGALKQLVELADEAAGKGAQAAGAASSVESALAPPLTSLPLRVRRALASAAAVHAKRGLPPGVGSASQVSDLRGLGLGSGSADGKTTWAEEDEEGEAARESRFPVKGQETGEQGPGRGGQRGKPRRERRGSTVAAATEMREQARRASMAAAYKPKVRGVMGAEVLAGESEGDRRGIISITSPGATQAAAPGVAAAAADGAHAGAAGSDSGPGEDGDADAPPVLSGPLTDALDIPSAPRRRAGLAYSLLCKLTGFRPPTPPPASERERRLRAAKDDDVDDDPRARERRRAMAATGGFDEAAMLRAKAEGAFAGPVELALADPKSGPRVERTALPGLLRTAGLDLVPGQATALLVHPRWLVRPVPGDAFHLASADGTRLDLGEFLLAIAVAGAYVLRDVFVWAGLEDKQFELAKQQEELSARARRAEQRVLELELANELAVLKMLARRRKEEEEKEPDPVDVAKEAAAAAKEASKLLERPADLLREEAASIGEVAVLGGLDAAWARLGRQPAKRVARAIALRFRERHGTAPRDAAFVCGDAAYELFRPGGAAPLLYQRARAVFFRHSSDGDFLYPSDFRRALADLTVPSLEAEDRMTLFATELIAKAAHAVQGDAWSRARRERAAAVLGPARADGDAGDDGIEGAVGLAEESVDGRGPPSRGQSVAGRTMASSGGVSRSRSGAGGSGRKGRARARRLQRREEDQGPLTLERALAQLADRCVPPSIRALLVGSPGQRSDALARLTAAEEQRRMLDFFRVVDRVSPPVMGKSDDAKATAAKLRQERRQLRLDMYHDEKDRREKAEQEREQRRKALAEEAALRKAADAAQRARERAEDAAQRSAMQKLEEAAQAEISRRGADYVDFAHELLEREPDAAAIARACAKTAIRAELPNVTLADCARLRMCNNYIRSLSSAFLFQVLQVRILDLSNNCLTELPDAMCGMGSLEILKLPSNALESLPERLGRMGKLRMLDLRGNKLKTLPPEVLLLASLEVLLLAGNGTLTELPEPPEGSREERIRKAAAAAAAMARGNVGTDAGETVGSNQMSHEAVLAKSRLDKKKAALASDLEGAGAQRDSFAPRIWPKLVCLDLTACGLDRLPYDCWWLRLPSLSELRLDGNPLCWMAIDFGPVEGTVEWIKKDEAMRRRRAMDRALGLRDKALPSRKTGRKSGRASNRGDKSARSKAALSSARDTAAAAAAAESASAEAEGDAKEDGDDVSDAESDLEGVEATADAEAAAAQAALRVPPWRIPRLRLSVSSLRAGGTIAGFEGLASLTVDGLDVSDALAGARKPRPDGTAANLVRATADEYEVAVVGGVQVFRRRDPSLFEVMSTTHTVLMREAGLRALPRSLRPWEPNLRFLDLSRNRLTALPHPAVGRLRSLRALNVSHNKLDSLPASLCSLTQLRHLDISGNPAIRELPEEFGAMKNLRTLLSRDNTALRRLPASMKLQVKLRRVDLAGCSALSTIRVRLHRLTALTALRCRGCSSMSDFPGSGALKAESKAAALATGQLATSDAEADAPAPPRAGSTGRAGGKATHAPSPPPNLRFLDLSESGVKEIDTRSLKAMPLLRVLELRHTGLEKLPPALARHRCLRVVDVRNNMLTTLPSELVRWFIHDPRDKAREEAAAAAAAGAPPAPGGIADGGAGARLFVEEPSAPGLAPAAAGAGDRGMPLDLSELSDAELERLTEAAEQAEAILGTVAPLATLLARRALKERDVDPRRIVTLPALRVRLRIAGNPLSEMPALKAIGAGLSLQESLAGRGPAARRRFLKERWRGADLVSKDALAARGDIGSSEALPPDAVMRASGGLDQATLSGQVEAHMARGRARRASLGEGGDLADFRSRQQGAWETNPGEALRGAMGRALAAARTVPSALRSDVTAAPPEVHGVPEQPGTMVLALQEHQAEALYGGDRWRKLTGARSLFDEDEEDARAAAEAGGGPQPAADGEDSGDEEAWACGVLDFGGDASQGFDTVGGGTGTYAAAVGDVPRRGAAGLARAIADRRAFIGKVGGRAAAVKGLAGAYGGPLAAGSDAMIQLFDPGADAEDALDLRVVHAMLLKDCVDRGESRGESPSCFALAAALAGAAPPPLTKRHRCTLVRLSLPLFPCVVPQLCAWRGQPPGPPCRPSSSAP
ncbi:LRRD1 [Symbiodinium sp. KB8]|nr:LRRD1 [Symbiodinium sp. KB8]